MEEQFKFNLKPAELYDVFAGRKYRSNAKGILPMSDTE